MGNTYYQDELRYLREVGPEFARANPEIARLLNEPGSDPDVERLLEGVAFLCGRIREKIDDELPELTANMMALLWPHYLRPIPSMSVMELQPELEGMQAPVDVPAGAEFASVAVEGTKCRYRSAWPVTVRPWVLRDVKFETAAARPTRLVLTLQAAAKAKFENLSLGRVQLYLASPRDPRIAFSLYLLLTAFVEHITVSDGSTAHDRAEVQLPPTCVASSGLERASAVLPHPPFSFAGYRLLQEYFAFKERFLFVDLLGLDRAAGKLTLGGTMEITIQFKRRLETLPAVTRDHVRLHCVPIVNLFAHSAEPVRVSQERVQYLVLPSKMGLADRRHAEVFSVDRVDGRMQSAQGVSRNYPPFYSFTHMTTADPRDARYFQTHVVPNVTGADRRFGTDTYISFVSGTSAALTPPEESISVELTCTNRHLPLELRAGDVREPTDTSPSGMKFANLLKPTATIAPPTGGGLHWRLISHLSLNYVSLTRADHFKELLRVYDFQSEHDAQKAMAHQAMLDGIVKLESTYGERIVRGAPLRGVQIRLELDEERFAGEGDAYLFATILDRFFALYVTLNSYSQLTVRLTRGGEVYDFPPRSGEQQTPAEAG